MEHQSSQAITTEYKDPAPVRRTSQVGEKESKVSFSFPNQMRFRVDLWVCRAVLELNSFNIENICKSTAHARSDF